MAGLVVGTALPAQAQRLHLGGGSSEPGPGDGVATLALAEMLEKEEASGPGRAVRTLAAALLRSGENAGSAGAEAVLAGLTLAAKREAVDAMLAGSLPEVRASVVGVASGGAPSIAVRDVDLLLRDALGPLVQEASSACGWSAPGDDRAAASLATAASAVASLIESRRVDDAAREPLREMVELFGLAARHPGSTRSALDWAELLVAAADALAEPPAWLDMPARDQVRTDFSTGAMLCLDKPDEARAVLTRTARVMHIAREIDALPAPRQSKELRDAVNHLAGAAEGSPLREPAAVARIDEVLEKALGMIEAASLVEDPNQFVRQARPMLGPLADTHRRDADALARLLPGILGAADPMTDPAVVAAVNALARSTSDLLIPAELTELLVRWPQTIAQPTQTPSREPLASRATSPLAERVRTLGIALAKPQSADPALEALRALRDIAPALRKFPGERELRAGANTPAWQRVTGGEAERLERSIEQARTDWLQAESTDEFAHARPAAMARVHALEVGLLLLRDAGAFEQMRLDLSRSIDPLSNRWPGVELTDPGAAMLGEGLSTQCAKLAAALASGQSDAALAAAQDLAKSHAAALALGRVEGLARARKLTECDPAAELGLGPPREGAWLIDQRHALAQVCRWTYEASAATGKRRETFLEQANRAAAPVVEWAFEVDGVKR